MAEHEARDCLFCNILAGRIPSRAVDVDGDLADDVYAFEDVSPAAPHHVLIIPRRHIVSVNAVGAGDAELLGKLVLAAKSIAVRRGIAESGYRLVLNTNADGGQTVFHLHLHLLGGRGLGWPPG